MGFTKTEFSYNQKGADPKDDYIHYFFYPHNTLDTVKIKLNFEYIGFGVYIKYFINSDKHLFRPYVNLGVIAGYQINKKDPFLYSYNGRGYKNYYDTKSLPEAEIGIAGKIGILYSINKNIGVYCEFRTSFTELYYQESLAKFTNTLYNFTFGIYL